MQILPEILLAELVSDRTTTLLIVLALLLGILSMAYVILRLVSFLDHDSIGIWVMAIDPIKFAEPGRFDDSNDESLEPLVECAVLCERICGSEFLFRLWPASAFEELEEGLMYGFGMEYRGETQIAEAISSAKKNWGHRRLFTSLPPIRKRLDGQLAAFCKIANFAKSNNLVLLITER